MNVITIASVIVVATFLVGAAIAILFSGLGGAVVSEAEKAEAEKSRFNPSLTMGHKVPVSDDLQQQLKAARKLAAQRAASLPRGANMRIGTFGDGKQPTTVDGIKDDPISAVRIAHFHSWQILAPGASTTASSSGIPAKTPAQTVEPTKSPSDLVPGKDYPLIEVTDDMSPAEKRKARIANAKARSAAAKAIKESGQVSVETAGAVAEKSPALKEPTAPASAESERAAPSRQPQPGVDYEVIEITEDMSPDEVRKARITNAKARSAAMKKFKESGGTVGSTADVSTEKPSEASMTEESGEASASEIPSDMPAPDYIDITDDMNPDEVRRARIHNAKARSAYNKALKEAGIDPSKVKT